jgi:hypothetical protein
VHYAEDVDLELFNAISLEDGLANTVHACSDLPDGQDLLRKQTVGADAGEQCRPNTAVLESSSPHLSLSAPYWFEQALAISL